MVVLLLALLPLALGAGLQYVVCRHTMRETGPHWRVLRLLRLVPALAVAGGMAAVVVNRLHLWQSETVSPLTQLLFVPGVPGVCALVGLLLGWRMFRRRWAPRIFRER